MDILGLPRDVLRREFAALHNRPGKGAYHADAVFQTLYRKGIFDPETMEEFTDNPALAQTAKQHLRFNLPTLAGKKIDGDTYKFLLKLDDGLESESVVIPMRKYKTLCVSSQVGCKMGCRFCETARMGFVRHLTASEIVAQVMVARHVLGEPVENIVFMGMGEPLDNFDHVVNAIRILSDGSGLAIPSRSITVSTVGHVPAILKLAELRRNEPHEWGRLRLAVSLNAPDDEIREAIMPVNGQWSMAELKDALQQWPLTHPDDFIFTEYVLLHGINDGPEHAHMLADYLRGLNACVNLIPYNPGLDGTYARPNSDQVKTFFHILQDAGQRCRIRGTKGDNAMAACGQLGNRTLGRKRPALETV